jgi:23S rRNA (guanosine2251-2'-O)-methyltransferase
MPKNKLYLVLDNIRSRENVGSIFRTADAAGVSKIYLCGITPTPPHEKISKAALGAEKWIPWEYHKQTWRLIKKLKKDSFYIVALEKAPKSINIFKFQKPKNSSIVLAVGNEVKGLSRRILKYCDKKVAIPMYGKKESLNVAVAFGIAVYYLKF